MLQKIDSFMYKTIWKVDRWVTENGVRMAMKCHEVGYVGVVTLQEHFGYVRENKYDFKTPFDLKPFNCELSELSMSITDIEGWKTDPSKLVLNITLCTWDELVAKCKA